MYFNETQQKILEHIQNMSNSMSSGQAFKELKQLASNMEVFNDQKLFYITMMMLTYYKFKWKRRRDIFAIFGNFMRKPEVFQAIDSYDFLNIP